MHDIHSILKQYFGYSAFRPLQEDIIRSVLDGRDALALLPTGGGKSVCFQVPALAQEGICLVVSPLIALMTDQVNNLIKRGIPAMSIRSGMSKREVDIALDNCIYGKYKFLYVSPERLVTDIFRERVKKMPLNLIAVDEAHCISQWGYDFRPPYLRIAEIREFAVKVPVLALTATATKIVCDDIQDKLGFAKKNIYRASFARQNISFIVRNHDDKETKLLEILNNVGGSGIIYVRNRKATKQIADMLKRHKISADHYHAGLTSDERSKKQNNWIENKTRIIVCTNAFGMGIDKPDVRLVIHYDIPDNPEAYYQEAGRAGRDGRQSFAGLIYNADDMIDIDYYLSQQFPSVEVIKKTYQALGNYLNIATGAGKNESFDFDLVQFCSRYKLNAVQTASALKNLQQQNYIYAGDALQNVSTIMVAADRETLYKFQVEHKQWDALIKMILRIAPGVFEDFVPLYERELGLHLNITEKQLQEQLQFLHAQGLFIYNPMKAGPQITYLTERLPVESLQLDTQFLNTLRKNAEKRLVAMQGYVKNNVRCRMQMLLEYFGERSARCEMCDVCIERNKLQVTEEEFENIFDWIEQQLKNAVIKPEELYKTTGFRKEKLLEVLGYLRDNKIVEHTKENLLLWKG